MISVLARNWWAFILRGIAAILFGTLTLSQPDISLAALILLFACYALTEGILNIASAIRGAKRHERFGFLLFEGLVSVTAGAATLIWPGLTAMALLYFIGAWALVTGGLEIIVAILLSREITGEWLLALSGVASMLFGAFLLIAPAPGAVALVFLIGSYAIFFGVLFVMLGIRLRSLNLREVPPSGIGFPSAA